MLIKFKEIIIELVDGKALLKQCGNLCADRGQVCVEVQIAGQDKPSHMGVKMANSSEGCRLRYLAHTQTENTLTLKQRSDLIETTTVFTCYENSNAVRIYTEVENISAESITLEEVSSFACGGIGKKGLDSASDLYFTRFIQSHHAECQPQTYSFPQLGLYRANVESQKRIAFANVGSWSTKEELPQGIIEDKERGEITMFQIESNRSWYYEIADRTGEYYLYLGGANSSFGGWCKTLQNGERYRTPCVALSFGKTINEVIGEMTKYRRHIAGKCAVDAYLPTIFNEYMHLSWDSPSDEQTRKIAPIVAKTGVEYYVIDCGWHDEEDGSIIYPFVGKWRESNKRFPCGVKAITDYIRSLGMKAGLWIEPEIIGKNCEEMLAYYDDDCFLQRHSKKICVNGRYFLDFRAKKVVEYMSETIRRMVEEYGAEYIKLDYNQDCGVGTDYNADSAGEGLEQAANAYLVWVDAMRSRFPNVLFETCSSGGMRMDYQTLSHFSIVSTSDQVSHLKYPYIAGNILSAVLPEQAAVWSYPIDAGEIGLPLPYDKNWVSENISKERVAFNMINSFLGRMHLASHLELLNEEQLGLVTEGVRYYNSIANAKKNALPYFPNGFTHFGAENVAAGFITGDTIYLAVWCLHGDRRVVVPLDRKIRHITLKYPSANNTVYRIENDELIVDFTHVESAAFFEMNIYCDIK